MEPNEEQEREYAKQYGQVVAKAWADNDFKQRLLADPAAVLQEEGIVLPSRMEVRMVENTDSVIYFTLPSKPTDGLSDEQLSENSSGSCNISCHMGPNCLACCIIPCLGEVSS